MKFVVLFALVACHSRTTSTTTTTTNTISHPTPTTETKTTTTTTTTTTDKPAHKPPQDHPGGCPAHAPNVGAPCSTQGLSCSYGGPLMVCNAGMWEARFSR